jgi:3-deoxy-D-manno-octulosonic-acid transferase
MPMTDLLAETALLAYRGSGHLMAPFAGRFLDARTRRGKEDPARRGERFGHASMPRPAGSLVWVHAASVGETMSVLPVVEWLTRAGRPVLLTSGTVTSATLAATKLPRGAFHQYIPMDLAPFVGRFLDYWKPSAALFVESEIWPATVVELQRRGIPQVLMNARLSAKSMTRWLKAPWLARSIFGRFSLVLAQSDEDAARLSQVGVADPQMTGNIKFDCEPLAVDAAELARLKALIGDRPILLAASTHPGEETAVAEAALKIRTSVPRLLTIIVPRHPDRRAEIAAELGARGFAVAVRSLGQLPGPATDIYLADTLGELGLFYRLASVAFIGGSLVPVGGHNPIEASQLQTAVLHGPHVHNAREIFAALDAADGALQVNDADELAQAAMRLLTLPSAAEAMAKAGADIVLSGRGALDRTMRSLSERIITDLPKARQSPADDGRGVFPA